MLTLNVNPARESSLLDLLAPRQLGRGQCLDSTGTIGTVVYLAGTIQVNGATIFAEAGAPVYLDFAYDKLDRPQITWQRVTGESLVYFYDGTISNYRTLSLGYNALQPAIASDYLLDGTDTILAYLKNSVPYHRLQSDRYTVEYQWNNIKYVGIKALGYGLNTNSIQLILG